MTSFTHIDEDGNVQMVDVTGKELSFRTAVAQGAIFMNRKTLEIILNRTAKKGNVLETARIAGIMSAKKTSDLIPLCHPINITHIKIDFSSNKSDNCIEIKASVRIRGRTGVEMEALTAVSVAALTIYDMCKSYDKKMTISDICLLEKTGGKSGDFIRR